MTIGSFTVDDKQIKVESDYSHVDGRIYRLIRADTQAQVAVTTYRGLAVADGVGFSTQALQDGLRNVLRQSSRLPGRS